MNQRQARIIAIRGITSACSLAADGMGDAFPQYNDADQQWTDAEFDAIRAAFAALHDELAIRLERLKQRGGPR